MCSLNCVVFAHQIVRTALNSGNVDIAWQAQPFCDIPTRSIDLEAADTCFVSVLWFCCGVGMFVGKNAKPLLHESVKEGGSIVWRGRRGFRANPICVLTCHKPFCVCKKCKFFACFSASESFFSFATRSTLDTHPSFIWHGERRALTVSCCLFFPGCFCASDCRGYVER